METNNRIVPNRAYENTNFPEFLRLIYSLSGSPKRRCKMHRIRSDFFCALWKEWGDLPLAVSAVKTHPKLSFL